MNLENGKEMDSFPAPPYSVCAWNPSEEHSLVYLVNSPYIGEKDLLVVLDPATGEKIFPQVCPDWFNQKFQAACHRFHFPYPLIGGQMSGLPDDTRVRIFVHRPQDQVWIASCIYSGSTSWLCTVDVETFGTTYTVDVLAEGYISTPISYTIQMSGTKAYVVEDGGVAGEANHLDFHFAPVPLPTVTPTVVCNGEIVDYLDAHLLMNEAGLIFYRSANGIWLTERVPVEYLVFPEG